MKAQSEPWDEFEVLVRALVLILILFEPEIPLPPWEAEAVTRLQRDYSDAKWLRDRAETRMLEIEAMIEGHLLRLCKKEGLKTCEWNEKKTAIRAKGTK